MSADWDSRLLDRARAVDLVATSPLRIAAEPPAGIAIRCADCDGSCGIWPPGGTTTVDDIVAAVLRHHVMAHDLPLSGASHHPGQVQNVAQRGAGPPGMKG